MNNEQIWNDTQAVSPVMATFILIIVAIAGGTGVAVMLGVFSADVAAESANTQEIASEATIEIVVAGCAVLQPITAEIAEAYMRTYPGIKVTTQGGGSHAGVVAAGVGAVNIGAASRGLTDDELKDYPDMQTHLIGGSAVVIIADPGGSYSGKTVRYDELQKLYDANWDVVNTIGSGNTGPNATIVQRADTCGTEDMMSTYLGFDVDDAIDDNKCSQTYEIGNVGVLERVRNTPDSVGFVDYGFAVDNGLAEVEILGIDDGGLITPFVTVGGSAEALRGCVMDELVEHEGTHYPTELARPMNYISNGDPNVLGGSFIRFAQSPASADCFHMCGMFLGGD